jgi:galactokinase
VQVPPARTATGPGRINLIGDHTDYNRGLALPMAIDLGVTVTFAPDGGDHLSVSSDAFGGGISLPIRVDADAGAIDAIEPSWARLVAAMVATTGTATGGRLEITTTLPTGAGLSSSAALSVALAEDFDGTGSAEEVARHGQQAEHLIGAPIGAMDPLVCAGATAGHALLIDFSTLTSRPVAVPPDLDIVVAESGQRRTVRSSAYAARVAECEAAAALIGPLGLARPSDLTALADPLLERRARHVVTECRRVLAFAAALEAHDFVAAGRLMAESHRSLAGDFEVSTAELDRLVGRLESIPGVFGARMTGAGFGGCVVALSRPGAVDLGRLDHPAWRVHPSDGTAARRALPAPGKEGR